MQHSAITNSVDMATMMPLIQPVQVLYLPYWVPLEKCIWSFYKHCNIEVSSMSVIKATTSDSLWSWPIAMAEIFARYEWDYRSKDIEHSSANKKRHISFLSLQQSLEIKYLPWFVVMISLCPKSDGESPIWFPPTTVADKKILVLACLYCLQFKSADQLLPPLYSWWFPLGFAL